MCKLRNCLIINPGSSSLKWEWFSFSLSEEADESGVTSLSDFALWLQSLSNRLSIEQIIIRFVHGGGKYNAPIKLTRSAIKSLKRLNEFAPLHNPSSVICAQHTFDRFDTSIPIYAVFDCEFFHRLPLVSQTYAIPIELNKKYSLRRYGFHGFAHAGMYSQWLKTKKHQESSEIESRVITFQLGAGCSAAAIKNGKPIDTSMGFTPNEGLIMATRTGDIAPGLVTWLQQKEGWDPKKTDEMFNLKSGWAGVSGESADFADLISSELPQSQLAVELLCWQVKKSIGAFYAILGGLDAIILGGGIAENAPSFCRRLLGNLEHLGVKVPLDRSNEKDLKQVAIRITAETSPVACWVIKNRESQAMLSSVRRELM